MLGGLFNTFPYSTFSENVGVLQLSGVKTRKPIYYSAFFLILLGLLPKAGAVSTIIPDPVLGGAMIVMFGIVGAQGVKILQQVNFSEDKNYFDHITFNRYGAWRHSLSTNFPISANSRSCCSPTEL